MAVGTPLIATTTASTNGTVASDNTASFTEFCADVKAQ
jgi:hypothetical protein